MKPLIAGNCVVLIAAATLAGCVSIKDTVSLEQLSVRGPVEQPPIHITEHPHASQVTITPRISLAGNEKLEDESITRPLTGDTFHLSGKSFNWTVPGSQIGADFDWMVSNSVALSFGFTMAMGDGESFAGGNVGLGLPFTGENVSGRFDIGLQFQEFGYDAFSVRTRDVTTLFFGSTHEVTYYHDIGRATPMNIFMSLTLNSNSDRPLKFFGNLAFSRQDLASFNPRHVWSGIPPLVEYEYSDTRPDYSVTFLQATPGIYLNTSSRTRILAGVRIMMELEHQADNSTLIAPMIQWDVIL